MNRKCLLTSFLVLLCSCGIDGGGGFRSSDQEYMAYLINELDHNNVIYSLNTDGYIFYDESQKEAFVKAQRQTERVLYEGISTKLDDVDELEYFVSLLKENNLEHYFLEKKDGKWVKWYPQSEQHEQEIMLQVVEYSFNKRRMSKPCPSKQGANASNNALVCDASPYRARRHTA